MSVQEIERAIKQLPREEVTRLAGWLSEYHHQLWDEQIENDLESGRLDVILAEAEKAYEDGQARPL